MYDPTPIQFSKYLFRLLFLLHSSGWYIGLNYKLNSPCVIQTPYNFLNTCFDNFSYFILQDGAKGLTTGSKIHVCTKDGTLSEHSRVAAWHV